MGVPIALSRHCQIYTDSVLCISEGRGMTNWNRYKCPHGIRKYRCVPCGGTLGASPRKCLHGVQRASCWTCRPEGRYAKYRCSAKDKGFDFTLSLNRFLQIIEMPCNYCGAYPAHGIDRLDNAAGYHGANCVACCTLCNRMKSDLPTSKFLNHIQQIQSFQQSLLHITL